MKSLKLRVRKTMFVFIAATGVFVLLFAQWRINSQALMSAGAENLTTPLVGLTTAQRADFNAGLAEFQAVETIAEGLGPVFNGKSCAECHAVPSVGGSEPNLGVARETRIGRLFNGVFDPLDGSANLYDTANPATVLELKEVLRVAASALGLTVRSWEVRAADDIDRVFAALNKQRPDGL